MVEALTIVLAVALTRGWRSTLVGVSTALLALAALVAAARAPLARVPENTIKFGVGLLLTTFGIFWAAEGIGVDWPGGDAALPAILGFLAVVSFALVRVLRRARVSARLVEAKA